MKYHYVYIITNKINHKFYIGKHSTDDLDDGYMGSGTAINKAIQKYGIENFSKRILCFCDSAEDAYKVEEFLVTDNLIKRDDCYNMMVGGVGGSIKGKHWKLTNETKKRISEALKGKYIGEKNPLYGRHHTEETKQKMRESSKNKTEEYRLKLTQSLKGHKVSDETRVKISETLKNNGIHNTKGKHWKVSEEGKRNMGNAHKGKYHSEETKQKMSEARKAYWENKKKNNVDI